AVADQEPARAQPLLPRAPARRERGGAARPLGRAGGADDPLRPGKRGAPARSVARGGRRRAGGVVPGADRPRMARLGRLRRGQRLHRLGGGRMNAAHCQQALDGITAGVAASLRAVDCAAGSAAQVAFGRLFGADGALVSALTILLTLYVAFFAIALITGRSPLGVSALTPRMMTVGLVLTFATSWIAYQGVVRNLAVGAPDQLAALLTGVNGSATQVFAEKIDVVFAALVDSSGSASPGTAGTGDSAAAFSPP